MFKAQQGRLPQHYEPPPPMDIVIDYYVRAFFRMSRGRTYYSMTGAPGPLHDGSIADYIQVHGYPPDIDEFETIIFALDDEYLKVANRKLKAKNASNKPGTNRKVTRPPGIRRG